MYFKRVLSVLIVFVLMVSAGDLGKVEASTQTISVKLSNYIGNKTELTFSFVGGHSVKEDDKIELNENDIYKVKVVDGKLAFYHYKKATTTDGKVSYTVVNKKLKDFDASFTIVSDQYSTSSIHKIYGNYDKQYLGDIKYAVEDGKYVRPTNINIPFEDYLKSVVPHEMPASWSLEALKAQAVAARTYSTSKIGSTVADTQAFQVYGGYEWHPNSTRAVEETAGKILKYNGYSIGLNAVYSSSNGGYTESALNLWGSDRAYLPAKQDPNDPTNPWGFTYNKDQIDIRQLDLANPQNWWGSVSERTPSVANSIKNWLYREYKNSEIKIVRIPEVKFIEKNSSTRSINGSITVEFFVKDKSTNTFEMESGKIKTFTKTHLTTANGMRTILGTGNMKSTLVSSNETLGHTRLGGKDRFAVAINVSQQGWSTSNTVVLANWEAFGDALAATPLAYKYDAPMLLTKPASLTPRTKDEIERLKAKKVIIVGGTISVSEGIEKELEAMGITVERISGSNRTVVANNIAKEIGSSSKVVIADGFNFPDALSIAPYAARNGYPILLTNSKHELTQATQSLIDSRNISQTIISGGPLSVAESVEANVPNPRRFGGDHRYDVSAKIANAYFSTSKNAFVTNGSVFADALTGSVLAAKKNAPMLLIKPESLTLAVGKSISRNIFDQFTILGGPISVQERVAADLPNVSVKLSGKGFGHGVGMSQYGAYKMATLGKKYDDILSFYYPGTKLENN